MALAAAAGLVLDPWQAWVLEQALGRRPDGRWAAFEVGLLVPRQNGKGSILEALELAGLFLFGEQLILHSAHEFKTAQEAFRRVLALVQSTPDLERRVSRVRTSHGEEGIELIGGQRLRFVARSTGSGRGFSGDRVILDEAYNLSGDAMAALLPTLSARPNPQVWYTSSAGMSTSDVLTRLRSRGIAATDPRLAFFDWSADPASDLDDPRAWAQANPALGFRVPFDIVQAERQALDDASFARERLGIWDETVGRSVIASEVWASVADEQSQAKDRLALAIDVSPDRGTASVAVAGQRADGQWHVELDEQRHGVGWLVDYVARRCERNAIRAVVIDAASPAASVIDPLKARKIKVTATGPRDMAQACGAFYDGVVEGWLRHINQPQVNVALDAARKRPLGDAWAWNRRNTASDITALVACTLALWGAQSSTVKKPSRSGTGRRAAVVL